MIIAVDTRVFADNPEEGDSAFIYSMLIHVATRHSYDHFIFFSDQSENPKIPLLKNVEFLEIKPKVKSKLSFKWWYDIKLPIALKRCNADLIICPSGTLSLSTKIPQVLVVNNFNPARRKPDELYLSKARFKSSLKKGKLAIATTQVVAKQLVEKFQLLPEKTFRISGGLNQVTKPLDWEEREKIKAENSNGCEYFFAHCYSEALFLLILKSFSLFKKWQKSNMKLVLINNMLKEVALSKLTTYKYKEDVVLMDNDNKWQNRQLLSASYAMIYANEIQLFAMPVLEAMSSGVPVIIAGSEAAVEIAADSCLFAHENPQELAEYLKLVYKNEAKRNQMIASGYVQANAFNLETSAGKLYEKMVQQYQIKIAAMD